MRWNPFGSTSSAEASQDAASSSTSTLPTTSPSSIPSSFSTTSSTSAAKDAHGVDHSLARFEHSLKDEQKLQEQQFPTFEDVPGCMRLLDEFLMCYALLPQLRNVYRFGELRDCTAKFDDFKYCMSLKGEDIEDRRKLWIRRRSEWWAARNVGVSSEDVWDVREKPLENFPPLYDDAEASAQA